MNYICHWTTAVSRVCFCASICSYVFVMGGSIKQNKEIPFKAKCLQVCKIAMSQADISSKRMPFKSMEIITSKQPVVIPSIQVLVTGIKSNSLNGTV